MMIGRATSFTVVLMMTFASGSSVEIKSRLGEAVHFPLPSVDVCGSYNLTTYLKDVVAIVSENSCDISSLYSTRSTCMSLSNGTVLFTLHHITESDFMTYLIFPVGTAVEDCWIRYNLIKLDDDTYSETPYWLNWDEWSSCHVTCGAGTRTRTRVCSIPNMCRGETSETGDCDSAVECDTYNWSLWSLWSGCDVTCGKGGMTRYRNCMRNSVYRTEEVQHCEGDRIDRGQCVLMACETDRSPHQTTPLYQWSLWTTWSACSQPCGTGVKSRSRTCRYQERDIDVRYCTGDANQTDSCTGLCFQGKKHYNQTKDEVVQLPLSAIIGAGCALFIIILWIVICVLVVKLRQKQTPRTVPVFVESPAGQNTGRTHGRATSSIVSFTSMDISTDHYDHINDNDVKTRDRQSVLTIDNPYSTMPKSPSDPDTVVYNNTTQSTFVFGNTTGSGRKISNAYMNTGGNTSSSKLTGPQMNAPRNMSIDSTGYLMPGTAAERAIKRNKKYVQQK